MSQFTEQKRELVEFRKSITDAIYLVLCLLITAFVCHLVDVTEHLYEFTRKYERIGLDEIILTLALSPIYLTIYMTRRFQEMRKALIAANTDPLIGLTNRRKGSELIREEIAQIKDNGEESSIIMFDIDNFKNVNDTYGHDTGDLVLLQVGALAQQYSREHDTIIRWGGEEFLVLSPATTLHECEKQAERMRTAIASYAFPRVGRITASFGVTRIYPDENMRDLIARVDDNLYASKRNGKNRTTAN